MKARLCFKGTKLISEGGKASYVNGPCMTSLKSGAARQLQKLFTFMQAVLHISNTYRAEQRKRVCCGSLSQAWSCKQAA